ncbi:reticulophagy regulator 2-like isoform X2 [Hetaerina americana]|uniref:reticulophagy regulator 2-like isoform X2 n=1 Tax=Hetaerina americana TaxID=62018 RepID=UPI003A7F4361
MSTWRTCLWRLWPWKKNQGDEQSSLKSTDRAANRFDQYAILIENVVVWENPVVSAACVLSVNLFFWIIFTLERKFYFIITLILWLILFYNFWNEQIFPYMKTRWTKFALIGDWCNQNCSAPAVNECGRYYVQIRGCITKCCCWMVNFRQEYPGLFCVWMIVFFVCLAALGQAVPGLLMAYIASMTVLIGPGLVIHVLPSSVVHRISTFRQLLIPPTTGEHDSEVDEYLPESNKETLAVLSQATDINSSSHVSYLDLDLDVTKMPSHDQESLEGSLDAPEEFELSPYEVDGVLNSEHIRRRKKGSSGKKARRSVDQDFEERDGDDDQGMKFESMHFEGGDSSSEEEELKVFSQGLSLDRVPQDDLVGIRSEVTGGVSQLLGEILVRSGAVASVVRGMGSLVPPVQRASGHHQPPVRSQHKEEEDSDEDFEMISEEDLS